MHDRRKVEEALEALSLGFSIRQAAELVGGLALGGPGQGVREAPARAGR